MPLTRIQSLGITDGTIVNADINASAAIAGTKLSGAGKVLQVVSTTKTDTFSVAGTTSLVDVTGLSVSITPSSASNKILITGFIGSATGPSGNQTFFHLIRGSTEIAKGDTSASKRLAHTAAIGNVDAFGSNSWMLTPIPFQHLDSPATTSSTTYKIQLSGATTSNTHYVNRSIRDEASTYYDGRIVSTITVMEIAA
jgi:hypothetical protein